VLVSLKDGDQRRYRCHTGYAFSADSLLVTVTSSSEEQLWSALRSLQESHFLLTHPGDHFAEANQPTLTAVYYQHANATTQAEFVRQALGLYAPLSVEPLHKQAGAPAETPIAGSHEPD